MIHPIRRCLIVISIVPMMGCAADPCVPLDGDSIEIIIETGSDSLRGDSTAQAQVLHQSGAPDVIALDGGFPVGSRRTVRAALANSATITEVEISIQSQTGVFETKDDWHIHALRVCAGSGGDAGSPSACQDGDINNDVDVTDGQPLVMSTTCH